MARGKVLKIPKEIYFTDEPRGTAYDRLIDFAQKQCDMFSLVWREDLGNKRQENEIDRKLDPFLISDIFTNKWPGTEILSDSANVCTYKLNQETANIIRLAKSLYQWEAPDFPEDIAFYKKGGELWLGSVAHEHMAWLNTASIAATEFENIVAFLCNNGIINKKYS